MASEATYAAFAGMLPKIYDAAFLTLRDMSIVANLVTSPGDKSGLQPRVFGNYSGGTVNVLAETDDMSVQAWAATAGGTVTPTIKGTEYFLNDTLIESGDQLAASDASTDLGNILAEKVDVDLTALFASFTGGTTGTAAGTITWANVLRAAAYLRANKVPQPYYCVLRPEAWYYLLSASSGVPTLMASINFENNLYASNAFFQASYSNIGFFVDANLVAGTTVPAGGMFSRDAIYFDQRRPLRIEAQRDASRGGGGYELNATIIYAAAIRRATHGVQMLGTTS
jgi:hypothetical protein